MVAGTLLAADNPLHQAAVEDSLLAVAEDTAPVRPVADPDGPHHSSHVHPVFPQTTHPHGFSQSEAHPPAWAGSPVQSRLAAALGIHPECAVRTAGAVAAVRTRLGLGAGPRTGVGPGRRIAVVAAAGTAAAAGSCSLSSVGSRRREIAVAGRCCICYRCRICYHCRISSLVPGRRRMGASMMNHQGCTKEAAPGLGSYPAGCCQSIRTRPVPDSAAHATKIISTRPSDQRI